MWVSGHLSTPSLALNWVNALQVSACHSEGTIIFLIDQVKKIWRRGGGGGGRQEHRVTCSLIQCNPYPCISNESNKSNQLEIKEYKETVHNFGAEPGILDE